MGSRRFQLDELVFALPKLALLQQTNAKTNFLPITTGFLEGEDRATFSWFARDTQDSRWETILNNFEVYARLAGLAGMKLQFDPEGYDPRNSGVFSFDFFPPEELAAHTPEEMKTQVKIRGIQIMQAIQRGAPGIDLLFFIAHSYLFHCHLWDGGCDGTKFGLLPSFMDGLLIGNSASPTPSEITDGYEAAYGFLTPSRFHATRKIFDGVASTPPLLTGAPSLYQRWMRLGFGMFFNYYDPSRGDEDLRLQSMVAAALRESDHYVWLYTENHLTFLPKDGLITPSITPAFLAALSRAKVEGNLPSPVLGATSARMTLTTSPPTRVQAGQPFTVEFQIVNTSSTPWDAANGYRLGSQSPQDNATWGTSRIVLGGGVRVMPGGSLTLRQTFKAPTQAGTYVFQWKMMREFVSWFGTPTVARSIQVFPGPPPHLPTVDRTPL
jgi:hypothetical protein